jgi:hypothetical protein
MKMLQFPAKDKALKAAACGVGRVRRRPVIRDGSRRAGGARRPDRRRSQAGGLGQVDAEAVAPALVAAGHLGGGMAEVALDGALLGLGRGGQPGAQRVAGEQLAPPAVAFC